MTRGDAKEALAKLGGQRGTIIGGAVGCLSVVIGLLLACGLLFGWVGNTVKGVVETNQHAAAIAEAGPVIQVDKDGTIVDLTDVEFNPHDTPDDASEHCAVGETVVEIWRGGRIEGWACNKDMTIDKGGWW